MYFPAEMLDEEQARFRADRSTVEKIFNSRPHQKRTFSMVKIFNQSYLTLRRHSIEYGTSAMGVLRSFNVKEGFVRTIKAPGTWCSSKTKWVSSFSRLNAR